MADQFEIFKALRRFDVPFVIVGGHAVNLHGFLRVTEDTDVVWIRSPESEQSLLRALNEIEGQYIGDDIDPATGVERTYPVTLGFIQNSRLMMLCTKHGFLDLFDYVPGFPDEDVNQLLASCIESEGLRFVSLHWLRRMKQKSARSKDLLDLENLPE